LTTNSSTGLKYSLALKENESLDYETDVDNDTDLMSVTIEVTDAGANTVVQAVEFRLQDDVSEGLPNTDSLLGAGPESNNPSSTFSTVGELTGFDQNLSQQTDTSGTDQPTSEVSTGVLVTDTTAEAQGVVDTAIIDIDEGDEDTGVQSESDIASGNEQSSVLVSEVQPELLSIAEPILGEASPVSPEQPRASQVSTGSNYTGAEHDTMQGVYGADVDLHKLIKPVSTFGKLELANTQAEFDFDENTIPMMQLIQGLDIQALQSNFVYSTVGFKGQTEVLSNALENQESHQNERISGTKVVIGTTTGLSTGISVGYLLWLIRGGTLMGSVLSTLPAWRFVDPLPVLSSIADDLDSDEESLASMVDK